MDATNSESVRTTVEAILGRMRPFFTQMVTHAMQSASPQDADRLERDLRDGVLEQGRLAFQAMLQAASDAGDAGRRCPHCATPRRHKGRRPRKLLTAVGPVAIDGVTWFCPACRSHEHATRRRGWVETNTGPLRELVCLLGISSGGFAHAGAALSKLTGIRLSTPTIAKLCEDEGRRVEAEGEPAPDRRVVGTLVGSCDGMMVHTREEGWRELRAWRFDDDAGRRVSGAALENAATFAPRLRRLALAHDVGKIERFAFVSDAAGWIADAVAEHLPEADEHVVDIWHAYQHIHQAARAIHGEGTPHATQWARRWCDELYLRGGRATWDRLRRARFREPERQAALEALLGFLDRQAPRMDYPRYRDDGLPISSGPMESTCKQIGRRLKGPGMRWKRENVTPMAQLLSLWTDQRWERHWQQHAA
jgi:hypothetical protein